MRLLAAALSALILMATPAQASFIPPSGEIFFKAFRDGDEIGFHKVTFAREGDRIIARTQIELSIYLAFVRVFHYTHDSTEVWEDGALASLESRTDDDGTDEAVRVMRNGTGLEIEGPAYQGVGAFGLLPTSYWFKDFVSQREVLNTQTGKIMPVTIRSEGAETLMLNGTAVETERYFVEELKLYLWYDARGQWVRSSFDARGTAIEYVIGNYN